MQNIKRIPYYGTLLLLAYMPFHVFLSQWLSTLTGGLSEWKLGKDLVLAALTLLTAVLVWQQHKSTRLFNGLAILTALYGLMHLVLWAIHPDIYKQSAVLGLVYNNRLLFFTILGYGAALLYPEGITSRFIVRFIVGVSMVVTVLGLLQYALPPTFLSHFGYSIARGVRPVFYIDNQAGLTRIMATLRDPNSLGAYLLVPIAALSTFILGYRKDTRKLTSNRLLLMGLLGLQLIALILTFSRSAWLGAILTVGLVVFWQYQSGIVRLLQRFWPIAIIIVVLLSAGTYMGRHQEFVRDYIIHNSGHARPATELDSDGYHWAFIKKGLQGIANNPLGHGPGTAGLASIQNPKGSFLTENYYVQIGYEVGVVGLALFVLIQYVIYRQLWKHRHDRLALVLLATFWAYVVVNMTLHTWSNEAVACQWWLLAGLALGISSSASQKSQIKSSLGNS